MDCFFRFAAKGWIINALYFLFIISVKAEFTMINEQNLQISKAMDTQSLTLRQNSLTLNQILQATQREKVFDMYNLNPDWNFAQNHGKAVKPGVSRAKQQLCVCCLKAIYKQPISLCSNSKELEFLGYGFPLYFIFMKYIIILVFLLIMTHTGVQLYWAINYNYDFCIRDIPIELEGEKVECTSYMVLFAKVRGKILPEEMMVRVGSFLTLLFGLLYLRDVSKKAHLYYSERNSSYAKYSILVSNLPSKAEIEQDSFLKGKTVGCILRNFLKDEAIFPFGGEYCTPVKMTFLGNFESLEKLLQEKKAKAMRLGEIIKAIRQLHERKKFLHSRAGHEASQLTQQQTALRAQLRAQKQAVEIKIKELTAQIRGEQQKIEAQIAQETMDCDKVIISFQEQKSREYIQKIFSKTSVSELSKHFGKKADKIQLEQAPEPEEINWKNIHVNNHQFLKKSFISWAIFLLTLTAFTVAFYFLLHYKHKIIESELSEIDNNPQQAHIYHTRASLLAYSALIFIMLFNKFIFFTIIHHLVDFERHKTGGGYQYQVTLKYTIGLFFTTALLSIIIEGFSEHTFFNSEYGLVQEQTIMFYFQSFLVPTIWVINPWYIAKFLKRCYYRDSLDITQQEANELMEDPEYLMGKRYSEVLETFWFTYLYASIMPFGSVLVFFGFGLFYWVDKYNLLRRSTILQGVSAKTSVDLLALVDLAILFKPAGQLLFDNLLRDDWAVVSIVELCIGALFMLIPKDRILDYFHEQKFHASPESYSELKQKNHFTYDIFNPLTKGSELYKNVKEKNFLTSQVGVEKPQEEENNKNNNKEPLPSMVINYRRKREPTAAPIIKMPEPSSKFLVQQSERSE